MALRRDDTIARGVRPADLGRCLLSSISRFPAAGDQAQGGPVGLFVSYNWDPLNGLITIGAARFSDGIAAIAVFVEGFGVFVDLLFSMLPVRKIYMEVPTFNLGSLGSALGAIFTEEARLTEHHYYDGQYWDRVILSLSRSTWSALRAPESPYATPNTPDDLA